MKYGLFFKDSFGECQVHRGYYTSKAIAQKAADELNEEEKILIEFDPSIKVAEGEYFIQEL